MSEPNTLPPEQLIDLAVYLAKTIAGDPEFKSEVRPVAGNRQTIVFTCNQGAGRLIGRNGQTFASLRQVIAAAAWRTGVAFELLLNKPQNTGRENDTSERASEIR